jgi:hypothetical protein
MTLSGNNPFKMPPWHKMVYANFKLWLKHIRYPKNVWYGDSIKREHALGMVGKGWSKLINNLYNAKPKHTNVQQVKEKYGTLRFYVSSAPEWYFDLIDYYEEESSKICEQCGNPGKVRLDRYWYLTLCDECDRLDKEKQAK